MNSPEVECRKPVWLALADFYLDTELDFADFAHIRTVLNQSGYTISEIKQINYNEVAPVLMVNLTSVAGVWDGFDEQWLVQSILARLTQPTSWTSYALFKWAWHKRVDYFTVLFLLLLTSTDPTPLVQF